MVVRTILQQNTSEALQIIRLCCLSLFGASGNLIILTAGNRKLMGGKKTFNLSASFLYLRLVEACHFIVTFTGFFIKDCT